ncbi:MAG: hypothetical protein WKF58_05455 [Ilumatobacteraceae bacterium]
MTTRVTELVKLSTAASHVTTSVAVANRLKLRQGYEDDLGMPFAVAPTNSNGRLRAGQATAQPVHGRHRLAAARRRGRPTAGWRLRRSGRTLLRLAEQCVRMCACLQFRAQGHAPPRRHARLQGAAHG